MRKVLCVDGPKAGEVVFTYSGLFQVSHDPDLPSIVDRDLFQYSVRTMTMSRWISPSGVFEYRNIGLIATTGSAVAGLELLDDIPTERQIEVKHFSILENLEGWFFWQLANRAPWSRRIDDEFIGCPSNVETDLRDALDLPTNLLKRTGNSHERHAA